MHWGDIGGVCVCVCVCFVMWGVKLVAHGRSCVGHLLCVGSPLGIFEQRALITMGRSRDALYFVLVDLNCM